MQSSSAKAVIVASGIRRSGPLDGHYLRRSDAEIFGEPGGEGAHEGTRIRLGRPRMGAADIEQVMEIAASNGECAAIGRGGVSGCRRA